MLRINELRRTEGGTALLEFALTALIFTVLIFGIVDVGRAAFAYTWVSNAARQATRFAMVRGTNCSGLSGGCPAQPTDLTTYVDSLATGIDTSQLTVTSTCVKHSLPCAPLDSVNVHVQYTFKFVTPLVPLSWNMQSVSQRAVQN
jgi:Flp pilus assembly protein TadG